MELVVVGLSHRTAPLELRERLAVLPDELERRAQRLAEVPGVREAAVLFTCNRIEAYAAGDDVDAALAGLRARLRGELLQTSSRRCDDRRTDVDRCLYGRTGAAALHHLLRVTSSLDSLLVGEPQILGQVKQAFEVAVRAGTVGPVLGFVFPRAFRVARRVRRETGVARQPVSVASVAVDIARQVWSGFSERRVLVIGAGKMADLTARALRSQGAIMAVTNRTLVRAEEMAVRIGAQVEAFSDLQTALSRADIVISATGARAPVLDLEAVAGAQRVRRGRPLVLIDIAVPRDVDPAVDAIEGVYRFDIDDLQSAATDNLEGRAQEAERAEALVVTELERCLAAHRAQAAGPIISALRAKVLGLARAEAEQAAAALPAADERSRRTLFRLAESIAAKLLHGPQVALKRKAAEPGDDLFASTQELFDLTVVEAPVKKILP